MIEKYNHEFAWFIDEYNVECDWLRNTTINVIDWEIQSWICLNTMLNVIDWLRNSTMNAVIKWLIDWLGTPSHQPSGQSSGFGDWAGSASASPATTPTRAGQPSCQVSLGLQSTQLYYISYIIIMIGLHRISDFFGIDIRQIK